MVIWSMNHQILSDWLPYVVYEKIVKNKVDALLYITSEDPTKSPNVVKSNC